MKHTFTVALIGVMILVGAGCTNPFAKKEETKPAPKSTPAANSDSQDDEVFGREDDAPIIIKDGWETYRGSQGFSFQYPLSGATTTWDGTERLEIDITNRSLDSAWLELDIAHISEARELPELCENIELDEYGKRYYNGILFAHCVETEGAAGSQYHTFNYGTMVNGWAVHLSFTARSMIDPRVSQACLDETVTDKSCEEFNPYEDADVFQEIIETFTWPQTDGISFVDEKIVDEQEKLILEVRYPIMVGATFADAFNKTIREDVQSLVDQITDYSKGSFGENAPGPLSLYLEPAHIFEKDGFVNVLLVGSEYTGGAHPNTVYANYIFNGEDEEFLTLLEFFDRVDVELDYVVNKARESLAKHPYVSDDPDWIWSGTEPKEENYQIAAITEYDVTIIFPPYQVGPYAVGPQEVTIEL